MKASNLWPSRPVDLWRRRPFLRWHNPDKVLDQCPCSFPECRRAKVVDKRWTWVQHYKTYFAVASNWVLIQKAPDKLGLFKFSPVADLESYFTIFIDSESYWQEICPYDNFRVIINDQWAFIRLVLWLWETTHVWVVVGSKSRRHILDGHDIFSHWLVVKNCIDTVHVQFAVCQK